MLHLAVDSEENAARRPKEAIDILRFQVTESMGLGSIGMASQFNWPGLGHLPARVVGTDAARIHVHGARPWSRALPGPLRRFRVLIANGSRPGRQTGHQAARACATDCN